MSLKRKIACAIMAAAMIFTATGCSQKADTKVIATYNGMEIPAGVYLYGLTASINKAKSMLEDEKASVLTSVIENDMVGADWILNESKAYLSEFVATEQMYEELGYQLSVTDLEEIDQAIEQQKSMYPEHFEGLVKTGVSEESYRKTMENLYKTSDMFPKYYSEGGVAPISEEEFKAQYEKKYRRAILIPISLEDNNKIPYPEDKIKELTEKSEEYLERLQGGEDIVNIVKDYYKLSTGAEMEAEEDEEVTSSLLDSENGYFPEGFIDQLDAAKEGEFIKAANDKLILIAQKVDMYDNMEDFENMKTTMIGQLKEEEFQKILEDKAKEVSGDIVYNEAALARYNVKDFCKRIKVK